MLAHDPGAGHPERAARLVVVQGARRGGAGLVALAARPATDEELADGTPRS
jgi:hypothetical protein